MSRTTNPLVLALVLAAVLNVVVARRVPAPWGGSAFTFLRIGVVVVVIRLLMQMVFGARVPGHVALTLPSVDLPRWAAGVSVGGPVTWEGLVAAAEAGFQLAVILAVFGAVNSCTHPSRLLHAVPASLYEAGVVVTVALSVAPEMVASVSRVRQARLLRGRPTRGVHALRGLALPVLVGALDRSVNLASSMDVRGFGRRAGATVVERRVAAAATLSGFSAIAVGSYGMLDGSSPRALGWPMLVLGCAGLGVGLRLIGRRSVRTRYRPDPWGRPEWSVAACGALGAAFMWLAGGDPIALRPPVSPLAFPQLPPFSVAAAVVLVLPALVSPDLPDVEGSA